MDLVNTIAQITFHPFQTRLYPYQTKCLQDH